MIRNSLLFSDKVRNYGFKMGVVNTDSEFIKEHIPPSKNKLQFIYEAIINSLEANDTEDVQIKIIFNFDKQTDGQRKLGQIDILDNGSGFTDESYERFRICANKSKKKNNRGCGRVQFYHNFKEVEVESVYKKGSKVKKRKFVYDSDNFGEAKIPEIIEDIASNEEMITCVSLKQYQGRDKSIDIITIDDFISSLQSNLLLRFYLENKENIKINVRVEFKIGEESEKREIFNSSLPTPIEEGEIKVSYERITDKTGKLEFEPTEKKEFIKWSHFKIENDNSKGNEIKLCSKNIPVCDMSKFCGLDKMCQHSENKYLTVFYGDVFDKAENVNDSVDGFKFPRKRDFKKEEQDLFSDDFLFYETIEDEIKNVLPRIYKE
ncbi:MAG: hypothetical protein LBM19_02080, partial [Holosporales bacterium]|nr:hypothetical protein [Holosporales bacterium]